MSDSLSSIEPATGAQFWQAPLSDVAAEVDRVASAWPGWAAKPLTVRIETMRRFANGVRAAADALADRIARETGRPLWDAHVIGSYVRPAYIPASHIVPALIAGNGALFKPSEKTPATGEMLVSMLHDAGVPADLLRCIIGGAEAGQALATHEAVRGILFTGTSRTGFTLARALADRPDCLLALDMGGNNPIIAWDTPDLESAAALIVQSAFGAGGQHCLAARRLIVREGLREPLVAIIRDLSDRLLIDHPHADPQPYMGPVIDMEAADGLTESFLWLMSNGGRPIPITPGPLDPNRP